MLFASLESSYLQLFKIALKFSEGRTIALESVLSCGILQGTFKKMNRFFPLGGFAGVNTTPPPPAPSGCQACILSSLLRRRKSGM